MSLVLGLHIGHDAACAVVRDGRLVAAVQLERLSRVKHHAIASLSNVLPIVETLSTIGAEISDVDLIVSSFQGGSVGGFGLSRPLIEPFFTLFDPFSSRHHAISHHLAHAHCAVAYSPADEVAVIVSDLAGSGTVDGQDHAGPFEAWYRTLTSSPRPVAQRSECLSMYRSRPGEPLSLLHREFRVPHNGSESHVCSLGALYENVTQAVFRRPHTHGSLMAMAAFGELTGSETPLVDVDGEDVVFRNDWQHRVFDGAERIAGTDDFKLPFPAAAALARRCQEATEAVILAYARRAARLSEARDLALGGGTFLNILANTKVAESGLFDTVALPSAPHDAGIAVGCAFYGARHLGDLRRPVVHDRLGPVRTRQAVEHDVEAFSRLVTTREVTPDEVAGRLQDGEIIARSAGRSEFGPRALGARSLLASPLLEANKDRLNRIKGRESWRPVAPIAAIEHLPKVFRGPVYSPWMTFAHTLRPEHVHQLPALRHPDRSTRAQSLSHDQDPWLHDVLTAFEARTGYGVLCNTSLNGPAQPILETPAHAIRFLLDHPGVDSLLLDDLLVQRRDLDDVVADQALTVGPSVFVLQGPEGTPLVVRVDATARKIRSEALQRLFLRRGGSTLEALRSEDPSVADDEVWSLLVGAFLVLA